MANGKVKIGFSHPIVALYNNVGGTVTYTNGMPLARGVNVSLDVEKTEDNDFFADNAIAETDGGKFKKGTVKFTVDGLHDAAERFIYGLPTPEKVTLGDISTEVINYGDDEEPPYVGAGYIIKWQSGGVETFQPMVLPKVKFKTHGDEAETEGEEKNWQTQDVEATICRDDTAKHNWKKLFTEQETEEAAVAILHAFLAVAPTATAATEGS